MTTKGSRKDKKNMSAKVNKAIQRELTETNGHIKGPELKRRVEAACPDEPKYSLRIFEKRIEAYWDKHHQGNQKDDQKDLDKYWAVSQWDDGLLPGAVDKLLEIQRLLMSTGHQLTKRRAYLIARIHVGSLEEVLQAKYPNPDMQNLVLLQISSFYVLEEQIAEDQAEWQPGDPRVHADTSTRPDANTPSLDQIFLIDKNVNFETVLSKWIEFYAAPVKSKFKSKMVEYRSEPALNDFINAIIQGETIESTVSHVSQLWLMELALRWMTLSTRDDLIESTKYEIRNLKSA
jgi:hypothetical protein